MGRAIALIAFIALAIFLSIFLFLIIKTEKIKNPTIKILLEVATLMSFVITVAIPILQFILDAPNGSNGDHGTPTITTSTETITAPTEAIETVAPSTSTPPSNTITPLPTNTVEPSPVPTSNIIFTENFNDNHQG